MSLSQSIVNHENLDEPKNEEEKLVKTRKPEKLTLLRSNKKQKMNLPKYSEAMNINPKFDEYKDENYLKDLYDI